MHELIFKVSGAIEMCYELESTMQDERDILWPLRFVGRVHIDVMIKCDKMKEDLRSKLSGMMISAPQTLGGIATLGRNMRLVNKAIERGQGYKEGSEGRNLVRRFVKLQRSNFVINLYTKKGDRKEIARNLFIKYDEMLKEDGYSVTMRGLTEEWMDKVMVHDQNTGSTGSIWERMVVGKRKEEGKDDSPTQGEKLLPPKKGRSMEDGEGVRVAEEQAWIKNHEKHISKMQGEEVMGGRIDEGIRSGLADGKEEHTEKKMIKRGCCSGRTKEEHIFVKEGQRNLYQFVWSTGGVELARKESRTWKWKMFTQDPRYNQVRREIITRKLGINASPTEDEQELVYSIGAIPWRDIKLWDGVVMRTDKEQHMYMLDKALRKGQMGRERSETVTAMVRLRHKIILEECKKNAWSLRMEAEPHIWEYHQRVQEKTGLLHDRILDILQVASAEDWTAQRFITQQERELMDCDRRGQYG